MTKKEIKYLFEIMELEEELHPYLKRVGSRGKWFFEDTRTFKKEGYFRVYPIGIKNNSLYIINPHNGEIKQHGFGSGDYTGHRVENYIIEDIANREVMTIGELKLSKKIKELRKFYRNKTVNERLREY